MEVVSYDRRVAQMRRPGDEDDQLRLAKAYAQRLRRKCKTAISLAEKMELGKAIKEAEGVLRKLRMNIFDLQDMLEKREQAH